ncbi:hypothetical protein A4G99_13955 [Haladaptatus sp. R4]|uniref:hypothetical protein n=1 Tax=Haladaptatus sp. R4 TaxID=1679489 RepID=UPI0007B47901|nr:hypothetical protein [Haladaptatus sp. R4]KZN23177.1 hypothetical protein A4G99_13955 [Haladaptatus sp. R4]
MVVEDKPNMVDEFVTRSLQQGETDSVVKAYSELDEKQLELVREAYERVTTTEISSENAITPEYIPISPSVSYTHKIKETNTIIWRASMTLDCHYYPSDNNVSFNSLSSNGNAPNSLWHYKGIDYSNVDTAGAVDAKRKLRFSHSVAGQHISTNQAILEIVAHNNGNINKSANRKVL